VTTAVRRARSDVPDATGIADADCGVLLADGLDLATVAARIGAGRGTVREHLKHVFETTGARSQSAVVALLRGFVDRTH
jgi:DNA-binding CsgD family transcriptional regulator